MLKGTIRFPLKYQTNLQNQKIVVNLPNLKNRGLLSYNFKFNFNVVVFAEIDRSFVRTYFFYIIEQVNAAAVDLVSFLFADSACQLDRSNRTEYFTAGTGFGAKFYRRCFQHLCYFSDLGYQLLFALFLPLTALFKRLHI